MASTVINTREDLDAIAGTPEHDEFMGMLRGTLWRMEKDDAALAWVAVEDNTTVARFGFMRADFPVAVAPALPAYRSTLNELKTTKIAQLTRSYQTAMYADVTVAGKIYPADRDYQLIVLTMASRASRNRPIPATIRGRDGTAVTLTPELLVLIEDALFDQGKNASDNLAAKVALVKAPAATVAQIDAVVW